MVWLIVVWLVHGRVVHTLDNPPRERRLQQGWLKLEAELRVCGIGFSSFKENCSKDVWGLVSEMPVAGGDSSWGSDWLFVGPELIFLHLQFSSCFPDLQ